MPARKFCAPSVPQLVPQVPPESAPVPQQETATTERTKKSVAPLTPTFIRGIKRPAKGRDDYPDGATRGLCLRVPSEGPMVWTLRMRDATGDLRRLTLGHHTAEQGLAWARKEAERMRQSVRHEGRDPKRERREREQAARERAERDRLTFEVLVQDWRRLKLDGARKARYAQEAERALRHAFAKEWTRPAAGLSAAVVRGVLDALRAKGKDAMAGATIRYGRACYGWARKRGMVAANPFEGQEAPAVEARDRVLSDAELAEVWRAAEAYQGTYGVLVRLMILTGQREGEVAGMAWAEIAPDRATWAIPGARTKNGREQIVPLPEAARALLPEGCGEGLVFPGRGGGGKEAMFSGWSKAKARLDELIAAARGGRAEVAGAKPAASEPWRVHDLRRTVATGLQRLGVRLEVTEAVLNHVSGSRAGIVGIYQRHDWAQEKRAALDAWAEHVRRLLDGA